MSTKEIVGFLSIFPEKSEEKPADPVQTEIQTGNVFFKNVTRRRTISLWDNNTSGNSPAIRMQPWKMASLLTDDDDTVGHSFFLGTAISLPPYPSAPPTPLIDIYDFRKYRSTGAATSIVSTDISRVIGSIGAYDSLVNEAWGLNNNIISINDVPLEYTQIGIVYQHPTTVSAADVSTVTGTGYVTITDGSFLDFSQVRSFVNNIFRIHSGADAGQYIVRHVDFLNNRLYLSNLDGSTFVGQATAGPFVWSIGPGRRAYFNEVAIIQLSQGLVVTGGTFRPGSARNSFILRTVFDKTGSDASAVGAEQQGSYYVTLRPYTHGAGLSAAASTTVGRDSGLWSDSMIVCSTNTGAINGPVFWDGGVSGFALDEANQRLWFAYSNNSSQSGIGYWRWKTVENIREIQNYLGTGVHQTFVTPSLLLGAGDTVRDFRIGPAGVVYGLLSHATAGHGGLVVINANLTTNQYTTTGSNGTGDTIGGTAPNMTLTDSAALFKASDVGRSITIASATTGANNGTFLITGFTSTTVITYQNHAGVSEAFTGTWSIAAFPNSLTSGMALDSSRARTGTAADVSTNGSNQVTSASGSFTNSDLFRAIKLTGLSGSDSGVYRIDTIVSGTQVTVTTLAGATVTFTTQSGGTFQIGERLYLFFNNGTTGAGKINYMESLAPGTFLTRTTAMTNGANCSVLNRFGENSKVAIDPANGFVYWLSFDTQQQINKYDPSTASGTHSFLTIANVQSPVGGTGTISTITLFTAIHANTKFDELWVGTDFGQVKVVKSTFAAATAKRYFGADNGTYANPIGFLRPDGSLSTNLDRRVRSFYQFPDGRMMAYLLDASASANIAQYSREADLWSHVEAFSQSHTGNLYVGNSVFDSIGNYFYALPTATNAAGSPTLGFGSVEVQYQWDNGNTKWIPLEVYQGALPNKSVSDSALSPGCRTKPIHAALENVLYGVKVGFTKNGTVAANDEYLGRAGQTSATLTDGATTEGSTTFTGSGFAAGDVGKLLRLEGDKTTAILTLTANVANIDTVTTGTKVYTFQTTLTNVDGNVLIGATASDSIDNLVTAINLGAGSGTLYAAATTANGFVAALATAGDTMKATALVAGIDGNPISTTETSTNASWDAQSLSGLVYKVSAFLTGTTLTLLKLNGTTFTPGTGSTLTYSLWTLGSAGSNAGPETASVLLADGFGKDNTQDISGITYDNFHFKTVLQENVEAAKFCVPNPLGVPGAQEMKVYYDSFPRVGTAVVASHDLATTQIRALPASEHSVGGFNGRKLVDGFVDGTMNASSFGVPASNRGLMHSSPGDDNVWYGTLASGGYGFLTPVSSNLGNAPMVDLGADAEVGFIIVRGKVKSTQSLCFTLVSHGLKANLYKANSAGGTPVAASGSGRTSGTTNLSLTVDNNTITTTGDFLGAISLASLSNGTATSGGNTLGNAAATFTQTHVGMILKITSVGDVGSYRITAVNGPGTVATVRNLNQTTTVWSATVSSIVYEVRDGVREEDVICVPSIAAPTQRLCIERLLTPTTAQVRVAPHTTAATQSWQCAAPTWTPVKRISYSTEAAPPEVKNNGTWVCEDGRDQGAAAVSPGNQDFKIYADLTDLSVAARTGRWWQLQTMPRGLNASSGDFFYGNFEFYSPTGARLGISQDTFTDNALQNTDFLASHINRLDIIQSRYNAMTGVSGFNGTVDLGGTNGDTLTLNTGGNKFLGYQTRRPFTDGVSTAGAGGNFSSATAAFVTSDVGRILYISASPGSVDLGYYRIATRNVNGTDITVTTPTGGSVTFTGVTTATFSIHEGVSAGGASPDRIVFLDDQTREYTIATINDALDSFTIVEARQTAVTGKQWEIRRPAFDTASGGVDSTKLARLVRPDVTYPLQSGDVAHDSKGALRFWVDDIGTGNSRNTGSLAGGNKVVTGTGFCSDDEGRLLYITNSATAANNGIYKIITFTNATTVTVDSAYGGTISNFTADAGPFIYKIFGDRRFRITKQVTVLKA